MIPPQDLQHYIDLLKKGQLLIYPTDTLYALGADIYNTKALDLLYTLKARPQNQAVPIGVSKLTQIKDLVEISTLATQLATHFLPGPLTLILKTKTSAPNHLRTHQSLAVRIPDQPLALQLYDSYGPLTLTSANLHGKQAYSVKEITTQLNTPLEAIDIGVLDGQVSTIVDATQNVPKIIREGPITAQMIKEQLKQ